MLLHNPVQYVSCQLPNCVHMAVGVEFAGSHGGNGSKQALHGRLVGMIERLKIHVLESCLTEPYQLVVRMVLDIPSENYPEILIIFRMNPEMTVPLLADRIMHDSQPFISGETTWEKLASAPTHLWLVTRPAGEERSCRVLRMQLVPTPDMMDHMETIVRWNDLKRKVVNGGIQRQEACERPAPLEFVLPSGTCVIFENQSEQGFQALNASCLVGNKKVNLLT